MKKKEMIEEIKKLKNTVLDIENKFDEYRDNIVIREWLIKTNFVGNLKDKNLIKQLKESPLKPVENFQDTYLNPAFADCCKKEKSLFECLGNMAQQFQQLSSVIADNTSLYDHICEQIRNYNFTNIKKFYEKIIYLEKLQNLLDEQRPVSAPKKATSVKSKKTNSSNIKTTKKKGEK